MGKPSKRTAHMLLFLLAAVVFYVGLGVGLQHNANLGTVLWVVAFMIVAINVAWIIRSAKT